MNSNNQERTTNNIVNNNETTNGDIISNFGELTFCNNLIIIKNFNSANPNLLRKEKKEENLTLRELELTEENLKLKEKNYQLSLQIESESKISKISEEYYEKRRKWALKEEKKIRNFYRELYRGRLKELEEKYQERVKELTQKIREYNKLIQNSDNSLKNQKGLNSNIRPEKIETKFFCEDSSFNNQSENNLKKKEIKSKMRTAKKKGGKKSSRMKRKSA